MKLNPYLSPCTILKDLGTRTETLHLLEEKIGTNLHHVSLGSDFFNKTPKVQEVNQESINGMDSN